MTLTSALLNSRVSSEYADASPTPYTTASRFQSNLLHASTNEYAISVIAGTTLAYVCRSTPHSTGAQKGDEKGLEKGLQLLGRPAH
jgi:hypothetical protein